MRELGSSDLVIASTDVGALRGADLSVARLVMSLRTRPGHVLVTGDDPVAVERLFTRVEAQLRTCRRVRVAGRDLDPNAVVLALWGAVNAESSISPRAMVQALVGAARLMEQPILVVVTDAEEAGAATLTRLQRTLECEPDAGEFVRLALLGGPRLLDVLRQHVARELATRIVVAVRVPTEPTEQDVVNVPVSLAKPARMRVGALAALGALALLAGWLVWRSPSRPEPHEPPSVVPPVPAPAAEVPFEPPTSPPEPPAAAPVPPPEPEPAPPATLPSAAPVAPPGRALQVGAFRSREAAEALRARLGERFGPVGISTIERGGTTYHRVRVGGFASDAEASAAAAALGRAGYAPMRVRD